MRIDGTWDEIAMLKDSLQGKRLRLYVMPYPEYDVDDDCEAQDIPLTSAEWEREGEALRADLAKVWPEGLTAAEAVAEQRRY